MGKGGQKHSSQANTATKKYALDKLETEELRKWAKALAVDAKVEKNDNERDVLLKALVSLFFFILLFIYLLLLSPSQF